MSSGKAVGVESREQIRVDMFDGLLAWNRQEVILIMINAGQLDPEAGMKLFEATTRPDVVAADKNEFMKGKSFGPDSPMGILGMQLLKLKPQVEE